MATMTDFSGDSRGQLLIVGGVVVAALLITAGVVFNTALFSEAQSVSETYGGNAAASEDLKNGIRSDITTIISIENEQMDGTAADDTEEIIRNIDTYLRDRKAKHGVVTELTHKSTTRGTRVEWTDGTAVFTNADGNETWDVTTFTDIRGYSFTPDTGALHETADPSVSTLESSVYGVRFNPDNANNETRYVYVNSNTDELTVRSVDATDTITGTCSITNETSSTVHFTTNTLSTDGSEHRCEDMWPTIGVDKIQFVNGDAAKGQFSFTVDGGSVTTPSEMETAAAVYAMDVTYHYQTSNVVHTTETRVAPEEP